MAPCSQKQSCKRRRSSRSVAGGEPAPNARQDSSTDSDTQGGCPFAKFGRGELWGLRTRTPPTLPTGNGSQATSARGGNRHSAREIPIISVCRGVAKPAGSLPGSENDGLMLIVFIRRPHPHKLPGRLPCRGPCWPAVATRSELTPPRPPAFPEIVSQASLHCEDRFRSRKLTYVRSSGVFVHPKWCHWCRRCRELPAVPACVYPSHSRREVVGAVAVCITRL
jgi:hypothetical protein